MAAAKSCQNLAISEVKVHWNLNVGLVGERKIYVKTIQAEFWHNWLPQQLFIGLQIGGNLNTFLVAWTTSRLTSKWIEIWCFINFDGPELWQVSLHAQESFSPQKVVKGKTYFYKLVWISIFYCLKVEIRKYL